MYSFINIKSILVSNFMNKQRQKFNKNLTTKDL